jgi:hypothetical protein
MGAWLKVNGESIYGTGHTPFFNTGITWKCTTKPGKLYFHILDWPGTALKIEGLESKVMSASFLLDGAEVPFVQSGNVLEFDLPEEAPDPFNTVIVVDIEDTGAKVTKGLRYKDLQDELVFFARDARIRGEEARYDWDSRSVSGFKTANNPRNELWWYHYPYDTDTFRISIEYACNDSYAGSKLSVTITNRDDRSSDQQLEGMVEGTGGEFRMLDLGEMYFKEGEYQIISFGLEDDQSADMKVRRIVLSRK